jgi:hypothetical protein
LKPLVAGKRLEKAEVCLFRFNKRAKPRHDAFREPIVRSFPGV